MKKRPHFEVSLCNSEICLLIELLSIHVVDCAIACHGAQRIQACSEEHRARDLLCPLILMSDGITTSPRTSREGSSMKKLVGTDETELFASVP